MRTIQREIVSALIFSKDGKILMGKKDPKSGGVYADCWHIPGGGINDGEDKITAIIREVKEEVGIDMSIDQIKLIDDTGWGKSEKTLKKTAEKVMVEMHFNVYKIELDKNSSDILVNLNDDLAEFKWTSRSELPNLQLTPPSITLFKKLGYL